MAEQGERDMDGEASADAKSGALPLWPGAGSAMSDSLGSLDGSGVLDALFSTNAAPILLIDPGRDGAIVDANPRAAAFYGHSRD